MSGLGLSRVRSFKQKVPRSSSPESVFFCMGYHRDAHAIALYFRRASSTKKCPVRCLGASFQAPPCSCFSQRCLISVCAWNFQENPYWFKLLGTNPAAQWQLAPALKPGRFLGQLSLAGPNLVGIPRARGFCTRQQWLSLPRVQRTSLRSLFCLI